MAPLTALSRRSKGKSLKTPQLQKAFIAEEVLLSVPESNIPFDVCTDASDLQLGAVIKQKNQRIAFFLQKLSSAQLKHPVTDKEMLSIVEVLKECHSASWGAQIDVCTDHVNLTQNRDCCVKNFCLSFIALKALTMLKLMLCCVFQ